MKALEAALVGYVIVGLTTFSAWAVYVFATTELPVTAELTTKAVWYFGRAVIWAAIATTAGGLFGLAAQTTSKLLGA